MARWTLRAGAAEQTTADVLRVLGQWRARSAFVPLWMRTAVSGLGEGERAQIVIEYDDDSRLLSFDAWSGDRRIYGADDWLG
jgi:hypothetical protein